VTDSSRPLFRRYLHLVASIVVPFVCQAAWLVVFHEFRPVLPDPGIAIFYIANVLTGFAFLAYELRWYSLAIAPFYFVLMPLMLAGFSLSFTGIVYDLWL